MADGAVYGSLLTPSVRGGLVTVVDPGSAAERAGLTAGDVVITADGLVLRDLIDWMWQADGPRVTLGVERESVRFAVSLERSAGESWGVSFASPVFDRLRTCRNDCAFCFMTQLPPGLRPALYLRDDDYRLSFLSGTFVTLTNLTDADVARISTQRLSPLRVSLHAVTPAVRESLICPHGADDALARFDQLVAAGIDLHVQIVLVPGVNDGDELERTLAWLEERGEHVASVGVVPLGYTSHQTRFSRSFGDPGHAEVVLEAIDPWRRRMRAERGAAWVYAADEFYLAASRELPPAGAYDGYPQFDNGIGMVRAFLDEWESGIADARTAGSHSAGATAVTLVTGELFANVLASLVGDLTAFVVDTRVLAVGNELFGGNVSVAGLLSGTDLARAIARDRAGVARPGPYLVPDVIFNDDAVTLDGLTLPEIANRAGADVRLVSSNAAGLLCTLGLAEEAPPQ